MNKKRGSQKEEMRIKNRNKGERKKERKKSEREVGK